MSVARVDFVGRTILSVRFERRTGLSALQNRQTDPSRLCEAVPIGKALRLASQAGSLPSAFW